MWLLFARAPPPDAPYWPGRRWLSVVDAVAWPLALAVTLAHVPGAGGLVLPVACAGAVFCAAMRMRRALFANHRYRFTSWRWGRLLFGLLAFAFVLRVFMFL